MRRAVLVGCWRWDAVVVEYVSRVPRAPLDGLIDDLYYLEGAPPYVRLTLPSAPSALLIVNLGRRSASAPAPTSRRPSTPTAAWSPCPPARGSSATHSGPGPSACTSSRGGRSASAELRDRLATADGPHEMLTVLEEE